MGLDDALGCAGGARREEDVGQVVGTDRAAPTVDLVAVGVARPARRSRPTPTVRAVGRSGAVGRRPMVARPGRSTPAPASIATWSVPRKSVTVTSARAPLRARMSAASTPLNRVLIGTRHAPASKRPSSGDDPSRAVRCPDRDPVARFDARRRPARRRTGGASSAQLGVGQAEVAVDDREVGRRTAPPPPATRAGMVAASTGPVTAACSPNDRVRDVHEAGEVAAHDLADRRPREHPRARRRSWPDRRGPRGAGSPSRTARARRRSARPGPGGPPPRTG